MDTSTLVVFGLFLLVVIVTLLVLALRLDHLESRAVEVPEQAVREVDVLVPALPAPRLQPLAVNWLVEGYCMKDRKMVEMMNPQPIALKNGKPATVGVCPHCGTAIYKIGRSYAVVEAKARVPEGFERIEHGRREMA